jgi:glycosyltransferase involved in cell wall biosynthesis
MNKIPKISIITPCFNAVNYIEQTILSIIKQDYDHLEYIIIDGGSTDGTVDIIRKYEDKLAYWISEPDQGQSDAINKGIAKATGDIFNWINADDYLEADALTRVAEAFNKNEIDILYTNTLLFNEHGIIRMNGGETMDLNLFNLLNSKGLNQMGMYWSLPIVKKLNGVNPAFNYSMDLDLFKRYLLTFGANKILFRNMVTGYFRLSSDSKTGSEFEINFHLFDKENNAALCQYAAVAGANYVKVIQRLFPKIRMDLAISPVHSEIPEATIKEWLKDLFYESAKKLFYHNQFKETHELLKILPLNDFGDPERKNLKSFYRWSMLRKWIQ